MRIVSFPDPNKLLNQALIRLALFMNSNNKQLQRWKVETQLSKYATTKPLISTLSRNLKWSQMRCIICRPDLHNLQTRKKAISVHNSYNWIFHKRKQLKTSNTNITCSTRKVWYMWHNLKSFNSYNLLTNK